MSARAPALMLLALAAPLAAQTFAPHVQHTMGTMPYGLVVTDLSGDGLPDVATANRIEKTVSVRLGDGAGGLGAEDSYTLPGIAEATGLAAGDVTGDGKLDLVACASDGNTSVVLVLRGLGGGTFQKAVAYPFPSGLTQMNDVHLADLDGDGDLDAVGAMQYGSTLYLARNNGAGGFAFWKTISTLASPCTEPLCIAGLSGLNAADLDVDGDLDLACCNFLQEDLASFANSGAGDFAPNPPKDLHAAIGDLVLRDIDEDGHLDALASNPITGVEFLAGNGTAAFADPITSVMLEGNPLFKTGPGALAVADLDGDGHLDVAGTHVLNPVHDVLVALGNGAGSFGGVVSVGATGPLAARIVAADLDLDGRPDLVVTDSGDGSQLQDTITLLHNTTAPAPPWTDAGFALAGTSGAPWLMAFGPLTPGSEVSLSLSGAQAGAAAVLVLGTATIDAPFKGGTLVPQPQVLLGLAVEPDGGLALSSHWPAGVPSGTVFAAQWWIVDAGGPKGLAASNGVSGLAP